MDNRGDEVDGDERHIAFSDVDTSEDDSDEEVAESEQQVLVISLELLLLVGRAILLYIEMIECFQPIEMTRNSQSTVIHHMPVQDQLGRSIQNPPHFKELTGFQVHEFHQFCNVVCPIVLSHARSTGISHKVTGRPYKLTAEQRVLSFVMYMKHDNVIFLDASIWNWARSALCDDAIFLASCVCEALAGEIEWPGAEERVELGSRLPQLPGCLGFVDGTLVRVRRPFENVHHRKWFQGRKKMYCMNSTVVVDHDGLFRFVDAGYPGSYHDVTILKHSWVDGHWRELFKNVPGYCEYLLGDAGYMGMERYVMRGFSKTEIRVMNLPPGPVREFNRMHAGYRVAVEWGIGGLKQKWRRLMKRFDITRPKFATTFRAAAIMTNFIHRRRRDMRVRSIGVAQAGAENRGWAGDY